MAAVIPEAHLDKNQKKRDVFFLCTSRSKTIFPEVSPTNFSSHSILYHMLLFESIADEYDYMILKIRMKWVVRGQPHYSLPCLSLVSDWPLNFFFEFGIPALLV